MRFSPDEPISTVAEDVLGFSDFVDLILASTYNTETPFVYGVLGDWGTGKTSVLKMLEYRLNSSLKTLKLGQFPFVPIWFNAWEYENELNPVYPLLHAIKRDYIKRLAPQDHQEVKQSFIKVVMSSALALTDLGLRVTTKHFTGEALSLKDVKEQIEYVEKQPDELEATLSKWADQVAELKKGFENLIAIYAAKLASVMKNFEKENVRFVILIDDLDRCLPQNVVSMLESIKNYLTVKNCIFMLGINSRVVYDGIRTKYQGVEIDGREYLEKILNYSFHVPEPKTDRIAAFASSRLQDLVPSEPDRNKFAHNFDEFGQVLESCRFNNPRKIKRILNRYLVFLSKYEPSIGDYHLPNVIRLLVLAEYFPLLFPLFLSNANEAAQKLRKIGDPEFDVTDFEKRNGISLAANYAHLSRMRSLFDLREQPDPRKPDLLRQAQEVFSITRLV